MASLVERERHYGNALASSSGDAVYFQVARDAGASILLLCDRITALEAMCETLAGAAEALRDDMLERARIAALLRKDDDIVVEAGNGVWFRFNEALTQYRAMKKKNDGL